jgi:hypothetical protein
MFKMSGPKIPMPINNMAWLLCWSLKKLVA